MRLLQATTYPFEITYGTGAVAGSVGFETMTLGSGNHVLKVPHQGFGMVYDSSMDFLTASCDGLFVSSLTNCNTPRCEPVSRTILLHNVWIVCCRMSRDGLHAFLLVPCTMAADGMTAHFPHVLCRGWDSRSCQTCARSLCSST